MDKLKFNPKSLNLLYIILFFSLFIIPSYAEELTSGQQTWQSYVPNWFPLFAVAIAIGFGLTGIGFMLSRLFQLPQLETWARAELFEVVGSAFLVIIIFIAVGVIDNLFLAATGKTPLQQSLDFTNSITKALLDRYLESVKLGAAIGMLSGPPVQYLDAKSMGSDIGGKSGLDSSSKMNQNNNQKEITNRVWIVALKTFRVNYLSFYAADVFNGHYNLVQSIALTSLGISLLSHALLQFVNDVAIPVLIPLGLLLSVFAFSRKMGRTLIAFGIGLYIFVPLSILIAQTMYDSVPKISEPSGNSNANSFSNQVMILSLSEFALQAGLVAYKIITDSKNALIPSCVGGGVALSSMCGIAAPACAVAFTMICNLFGQLSDVGQSTDISTDLSRYIAYIKKYTLAKILDVPDNELIKAGGDTLLALIGSGMGLAIINLLFSTVFHLFPNNVLIFNYLIPALKIIINQGVLIESVISLNIDALLNKYLAIKLTNITLAYTPYVMQYAVPVLLIPFILIFVVITGIRSLSPAIGGEIQILGVSELI